MTDGGAAFHPGQEEPSYRPRSAYVGHEVFGHGDGAVLVEPEVARDLRDAAEEARVGRRITGGLLYGRGWADDEGGYLVVDGFLKAGPGENRGDHATRDGSDTFALSDQDLGLLREDAARMYSAAVEVGWWRTLPDPGQFGPRDFATQGQLVGPAGVGLLVFGSGVGWGTAYLGPDGRVPDSARSFIPVPRPAPDAPPRPARELPPVPGPPPEPEADLEPEPAAEPEPALELEPVTAAVAGPSQATRPLRTPPQAGPRHYSPVPVPRQDMGIKPRNPSYVGPRLPTDVKIVIVALVIAIIVAAVIIGKLSSSLLVAVIVAVVALLVAMGVIVFSRI